MKQKYSIGLFVLIITIVYILFISVPAESKEQDSKTNIRNEMSVSTDGNVYDKECFYLYNLNGYIVVYENDHQTIYEYTNIVVDELPENLQKELKNGKYIPNQEELYGFLENYSS